MENVKILARPEAYKLLSTPSESWRLQEVVSQAIKLKNDARKLDFAMLPKLDFYITTRWAKKPSEASIILIWCNNDQVKKGYCLRDPDEMELAIGEALPIPFFD